MLGEAAMTGADAARYARDYSDAIASIAKACDKGWSDESGHLDQAVGAASAL